MTIKVDPILERFGAEISGVDITRPLDEATQSEIRAIQKQWGVTVWRNTGLTDETHVAFSRVFGDLINAPKRAGGTRMSLPELFDASNLDRDGEIETDERSRLYKRGDRLWHSDSSFIPQRSSQSLLLCHEAPANGGQTCIADTRTAYEDLPPAMKELIEGLEAEHCHAWSRRRAGMPHTEEEIDAMPGVRHRLVHVHPGSGRKSIYVGSHARDILGMPRDEGRALIDELIAWCSKPEYTFCVSYKPGDMAIWDNLCSLHRGGDFDETRDRRDMRRTTVASPEGLPMGTVREPIAA
jgi:alpha-ketoglutarate-dependent 2,4-dichlorophenoxyacetate dioxygenase